MQTMAVYCVEIQEGEIFAAGEGEGVYVYSKVDLSLQRVLTTRN